MLYTLSLTPQGIKGAAIATTLSQYFSFIYIIYIIYKNIRKQYNNEQNHIHTNTLISTTTSADNSSILAYIRSKYQKYTQNFALFLAYFKTKFINRPNLTDIKRLIVFSGPLFFILLVKSFLWSYTTYACSTSGSYHIHHHNSDR